MPYRQADSPQKIGSPVSPASAGELGGQPTISRLTKSFLPFPGRMSIGKSGLSPLDTVNFCLSGHLFSFNIYPLDKYLFV